MVGKILPHVVLGGAQLGVIMVAAGALALHRWRQILD